MRLNRNIAQSTAEHVILVGIIAAAVISMQVYMKRGIQFVVRAATDEVGAQDGAVYNYRSESQGNAFSASTIRRRDSTGGAKRKNFTVTEETNGRSSSESIVEK